MRKILIIILVLMVAALGAVYFFYYKPRVQHGQSVPAIMTSFFPEVTSTNNSFGPDADTNQQDGEPGSATTKPFSLKQMSPRPIAGYTVFTLNTDHYIRYVGRANGYVYEIKNTDIPLQITNILIPNIYEAFFADANNTALLRFLRPDAHTIATYSVPIPPLNTDGTRTQAPGTYLPDNIDSLAISPDQKQILRILPDGSGVTVSSSTTVGKSIKALYKSAFTSWLPQWNASGIYLQSKASNSAEGYVYQLEQSTSRLKRIIGNVRGLTSSVSPSGAFIVYSESTDTGIVTKVFNTRLGTTTTINLQILPEKCVWLANEDLICAGNNSIAEGNYPDAWYAGTIRFSDELYRITPGNNTYTTIYDNTDRSFDMVNLQVDEELRYLFFVDKNTGILWRTTY